MKPTQLIFLAALLPSVLLLESWTRADSVLVSPLGGTLYVDALEGDDATGDGSSSSPYRTIGKGVSEAQATGGGIVRVLGRICDGNPVGYSDDPFVGEAFPISVGSNIQIMGDASKGEFPRVWTTIGGANPPVLFLFDDSNGPIGNSSVEKMGLYGGSAGVRVLASNGNAIEVAIKKITFSRNNVGVDVTASDGSIVNAAITGCHINDGLPMFNWFPGISCEFAGPVAQSMRQGIKLYALQTGIADPGAIDAEIQNLSTSGLFARTETSLLSLIDVKAEGNGNVQHAAPFDNIARVDLDIIGCTKLNGKARDENGLEFGWNRCVNAVATFPESYSGRILDYGARYSINISGSRIYDFRKTGIYGHQDTGPTNGADTRGQIHIFGGTEIYNTGSQLGGVGDDDIGVGVLMAAGEGYSSYWMEDSVIRDNASDGFRATAHSTDVNIDAIWPNGVLVRIAGSEVYKNLRHGLNLEATSGSVGSTWHWSGSGGGTSFKRVITEPVALSGWPEDVGLLKYGQGYVDRSTVNNNGSGGVGDGVRVAVTGASHAGLAVTNALIWNNAGTGINLGSGGILFSPVVQSTVTGNLVTNMHAPADMLKVWRTDPLDPIVPPELIWTAIYGCIFERQDPADPDFSADLESVLRVAPEGQDEFLIHGAGTRAVLSVPAANQPWVDEQTNIPASATPFAGSPVDWDSIDPSQFFLAVGTGMPFANQGYANIGNTGPEPSGNTMVDFSGDARPGFTLRDKGGEEL